jgi:hypothetical protein
VIATNCRQRSLRQHLAAPDSPRHWRIGIVDPYSPCLLLAKEVAMRTPLLVLVVATLLAAMPAMASPSLAQEDIGGGVAPGVPDIMVSHRPAKGHRRPAVAAPSAGHRKGNAGRPRRGRRIGSGSPIVPPPVPIGPVPNQPMAPVYRPPVVQVPPAPSYCVTRGQAFDPATRSFQTSPGICR